MTTLDVLPARDIPGGTAAASATLVFRVMAGGEPSTRVGVDGVTVLFTDPIVYTYTPGVGWGSVITLPALPTVNDYLDISLTLSTGQQIDRTVAGYAGGSVTWLALVDIDPDTTDPSIPTPSSIAQQLADRITREEAATTYVTTAGLPDLVQGKADVSTVYSRTASDARFAPIDINAAGVIKHGSDPNVARGTAAGYRIWVGSVYPVNSLPGDVWVVATQKAVEPPISWFAQYRASTIGSADLATLTSWADSSGNARNLTQATAAKRPVFHVASGGVPAYITFDGSKNMQTAAFAAAMTQPYTLMMTVRMLSVSISAAVTKRIIDGLDATAFLNFQQRGDGTNAKWQASAGTTVSGSGVAVANAWAVVTLTVNGSGSKIRINGVDATGNLGAALLGGLTVGSKFDSTVFADFDTTDIRLAAGLLSASQIANVEAALADSVGIILSA